jgi:hypothetical protein
MYAIVMDVWAQWWVYNLETPLAGAKKKDVLWHPQIVTPMHSS